MSERSKTCENIKTFQLDRTTEANNTTTTLTRHHHLRHHNRLNHCRSETITCLAKPQKDDESSKRREILS